MGSWCPVCAGNKKYTLEELHDFAKTKGGECLEVRYLKEMNRSKARWRCRVGHTWKSTVTQTLSRGDWCPYCGSSAEEQTCRAIIEAAFKVKFVKARPKWLRSSRGASMELDGYSEILKLAFEYNSRYHYEPSFFNGMNTQRIKELDREKQAKCETRGILLVSVRQFRDVKNIQKCIHEVRTAFEEVGAVFPTVSPEEIDLETVGGRPRGVFR
jgi:hypothetical protein